MSVIDVKVMFNLQTSTTMKLLPLVCLCLLTWSGGTFGDQHEVITVEEGSDVILPCSLSTSENIESKLFDWKKDGQKRVFFYDSGIHSKNSPSGQDVQFTGRVSHFPDELKHGNASIIIRNTKVADSGDYTCGFPLLQPERKIFHIQLVVGGILKDRSEKNTPEVKVEGGSDVILPCSLSTSEDIELELFDWKKDGQKDVFFYNSGIHSINSPSGQDVQFRGRVSHFKDELKHGNASIIIINTKVADSGDYTCGFPRLPTEGKVHIQLVVVEVIKVEDGSDVILPCSLSTSENIELELFDWKKDGQKRVFLYNSGIDSSTVPSGQDVQFRGRVSHFPVELKHGNASIIIRNTKVADSGDYTCGFPLLPTERKVHIQLVVVGAAPKPYVTALNQTEDGVLLQCVVRGVFPKPQLQWQDSSGNILPAKEPQVSERGGSYDVILQATVTKTDRYRCVATQEEINHQTYAETYVPVNGVILKDRSEENIPGAAPKPYVTALNQTEDGVLLQCEVRGASPKPQLQWQDSAGNILPAKEPQVSERGGSYNVILQATVTKTDNYRCVATQEEINHQTHAEIYAVNESSTESSTGLVVAAVFITLFVAVVVVLLIVLYAKGVIPLNCKKDIQHPVGVYTHDSSRDKSDQTAGQELNSQVNQPLNETA